MIYNLSIDIYIYIYMYIIHTYGQCIQTCTATAMAASDGSPAWQVKLWRTMPGRKAPLAALRHTTSRWLVSGNNSEALVHRFHQFHFIICEFLFITTGINKIDFPRNLEVFIYVYIFIRTVQAHTHIYICTMIYVYIL